MEKADLKAVSKKGRKEDWENYRLVSPTRGGDMASHPAATSRHLKEKKGIAEHMWEGKEGAVMYPDISKTFDKVSHSLLTASLLAAGLKKWNMWWVGSWLNDESQISSMVQSPPGSHLLVASLSDQPLTTAVEHFYSLSV